MHSIICDELLQRVTMKAHKVIHENLIPLVNYEKFTSINILRNQSQSGVWRAVIGCSIGPCGLGD